MHALSKTPKLSPAGSGALRSLFPADIAVAETGYADQEFPLYDAEWAYVARAHPSRRLEFAAGRHCARAALAKLGVGAGAIPRNEKGAPCWPNTVIGSISHADGYAAAAVASRYDYAGVGIDVTRVGGVDAKVWHLVMTPGEVAWLRAQPHDLRATHAAVVFGVKEAFFKCQHAVTGAWLDFKAVEVSLTAGRPELRYVAVPQAVRKLPLPVCTFQISGQTILAGVMIALNEPRQHPDGASSARAT